MSHGHGAKSTGKAKEVIEAHIAAVTRDYIVQPRLGTFFWFSVPASFSFAAFSSVPSTVWLLLLERHKDRDLDCCQCLRRTIVLSARVYVCERASCQVSCPPYGGYE